MPLHFLSYSPCMLNFLSHPLATLCFTAILGAFVHAQSILPPPGQPMKSGTPGQFEIVAESLVSAQQVDVIFHSLCMYNGG